MPNLNPAKFFNEVKSELEKVTWPTKQQVIKLTLVVVVISLIVGFFLGGLDFIFTKTMKKAAKNKGLLSGEESHPRLDGIPWDNSLFGRLESYGFGAFFSKKYTPSSSESIPLGCT